MKLLRLNGGKLRSNLIYEFPSLVSQVCVCLEISTDPSLEELDL